MAGGGVRIAGLASVIGVLGPNPFGPVLERTLAGRTVRGRRIELRLLEAAADVEGCHAVFMAWEEYRLDPALRSSWSTAACWASCW